MYTLSLGQLPQFHHGSQPGASGSLQLPDLVLICQRLVGGEGSTALQEGPAPGEWVGLRGRRFLLPMTCKSFVLLGASRTGGRYCSEQGNLKFYSFKHLEEGLTSRQDFPFEKRGVSGL